MDLGIDGVSGVVALKSGSGKETFKAHHERSGGLVVVKLLPEEANSLIVGEMRKLESVTNGPGIVQIRDHGITKLGRPYLITDYCEESLLGRLAERGPMGPFRACAVLAEVADGLVKAHGRGAIHGNIRPSNVMSDDGSFLLTDFGSAGSAEFDGESPRASASYAAPEDLDAKARPSTSSDVYGLGATLFHLVTGRAPFADQPDSALSRKLPNLRGSALPDEVSEVIESAMAVSQRQRPSMSELRQLLQRAARAGGQKIGTARPSPSRPPQRAESPRPTEREDSVGQKPDHDAVSDAPSNQSPLGPDAVPMRGTAAQVRELRLAKEPKEKLDNSWATSALAVLLLVGAVGILFFGLRARSSSDTSETETAEEVVEDGSATTGAIVGGEVVVPDVEGQAEAAALAALGGQGILASLDFESSENVEKGSIIRTEPAAGGAVASGQSVVIIVSTGPESVECATIVVPDLAGSAVAVALDTAEAAGFRAALVQQPSDADVPGNVVLTSLEAGTCVPVGSDLTIVIACSSLAVPDLTQLPVVQLEAQVVQLQEQGLNLASGRIVRNDLEAGAVVGTNPPAGTLVCTTSTLTINIAETGDVNECPQVPAVTGLTQTEAEAFMSQLGYDMRIRTVAIDGALVGQVVSTTPGPGTPLCAGGVVTIDIAGAAATGTPTTISTQTTAQPSRSEQAIVSTETGNDEEVAAEPVSEVSVPYVFYLDVSDAERTISEVGLVSRVSGIEPIYAAHPFVGTVRSTNPASEAAATVGTAVALFI